MNVRRVTMDVDTAVRQPEILDLAAAIDRVDGVEAFNITVGEIDMETVGMDVTVEGESVDLPALVAAVERCGAAVHSIDQLVVGARIIEAVPRQR